MANCVQLLIRTSSDNNNMVMRMMIIMIELTMRICEEI